MNARTVFEAFGALAYEAQVDALVIACADALRVWKAWADAHEPRYTDGVVGMRHVVDVELPGRALAEVRARKQSPSTTKEYLEPITAMQDDDLEMPDPIEYAYYAIYNLHRLIFEPDSDITAALVLNQAISAALETSDPDEIDVRMVAWWNRVTTS
jgi:hypothetical protein